MFCSDETPKHILFAREQLLSDGTLSRSPHLGWIQLITEDGTTYDSRRYGHLKSTPRVQWSPASGSVLQLPSRAEPVFFHGICRAEKTVTVTLCVTDERIAGSVLHDFCRDGKLVISTHPNLYYNVTTLAAAKSTALSRRHSEIEITYTASAYRYLWNDPLISYKIDVENGTLASGTFSFSAGFPHSDEESLPQIYFSTQTGAQAPTISVKISADGGDTFSCKNLSPGMVYCIDSPRMLFYAYGTCDAAGNVTKNDSFTDATRMTAGNFPTLKAGTSHFLTYDGYLSGVAVRQNARWNI